VVGTTRGSWLPLFRIAFSYIQCACWLLPLCLTLSLSRTLSLSHSLSQCLTLSHSPSLSHTLSDSLTLAFSRTLAFDFPNSRCSQLFALPPCRGRANSAHTGQARPNYGFGFQVEVPAPFELFALRSDAVARWNRIGRGWHTIGWGYRGTACT